MLSPSARAANDSAFAIASISASFLCRIGNKSAAAASMSTPPRARVRGAIRAKAPARCRCAPRPDLRAPASAILGFGRGGAAEEAARRKHEDENQDRENDYVGPAHRNQLTAEALDQPDDEAADHRAGDAADAAEHGRREGPQAGRIADDETGV